MGGSASSQLTTASSQSTLEDGLNLLNTALTLTARPEKENEAVISRVLVMWNVDEVNVGTKWVPACHLQRLCKKLKKRLPIRGEVLTELQALQQNPPKISEPKTTFLAKNGKNAKRIMQTLPDNWVGYSHFIGNGDHTENIAQRSLFARDAGNPILNGKQKTVVGSCHEKKLINSINKEETTIDKITKVQGPKKIQNNMVRPGG